MPSGSIHLREEGVDRLDGRGLVEGRRVAAARHGYAEQVASLYTGMDLAKFY